MLCVFFTGYDGFSSVFFVYAPEAWHTRSSQFQKKDLLVLHASTITSTVQRITERDVRFPPPSEASQSISWWWLATHVLHSRHSAPIRRLIVAAKQTLLQSEEQESQNSRKLNFARVARNNLQKKICNPKALIRYLPSKAQSLCPQEASISRLPQ